MKHIATGILFVLTAVTGAAQTFSTPFLGQALGVQKDNSILPVALRAAPPDLTAGSYKLAPIVCAVFPGTTFFATDRFQLATRETWYFVQIVKPTLGPTSCTPNVAGWMVGQLKDGRSAIAIQQPGATPPPGTAQAAQTQQKVTIETVPTGGGELSPYITYPLLILGTLFAVVVLTWERHRKVTVPILIERLTIFEFVALSIANLVALSVLAPAYRQIEPDAWGAKMLQQLTGTPLGHLLLGFILTVVIMKSVSFAASNGDHA